MHCVLNKLRVYAPCSCEFILGFMVFVHVSTFVFVHFFRNGPSCCTMQNNKRKQRKCIAPCTVLRAFYRIAPLYFLLLYAIESNG